MSVDENNVTMPIIKIESTQREVAIPSSNLRMKNDRDKDDIKLVNKRRKIGSQPSIAGVGDKNNQDVFYKMGDVVLIDENKVHAYIIEADEETVKVVTEYGNIKTIR